MSSPLTPQNIVFACSQQGHHPVLSDVIANWPLIQAALLSHSALSIPAQIAAIATIAVECNFKCIEEQGSPAYFKAQYGNRLDWAVDNQGLWLWRGRGFIQISTKANYEKYSVVAGVNLITNPHQALVPAIAAKIAAAYYADHGLDIWANRGHWWKIRELVNGGTNGLPYYLACVEHLLTKAYT